MHRSVLAGLVVLGVAALVAAPSLAGPKGKACAACETGATVKAASSQAVCAASVATCFACTQQRAKLTVCNECAANQKAGKLTAKACALCSTTFRLAKGSQGKQACAAGQAKCFACVVKTKKATLCKSCFKADQSGIKVQADCSACAKKQLKLLCKSCRKAAKAKS